MDADRGIDGVRGQSDQHGWWPGGDQFGRVQERLLNTKCLICVGQPVWRRRTKLKWRPGTATARRFCDLMIFLAGFNASFSGRSTGWKAQPGGSWSPSSSYYYTSGSSNKWSTARYNGTYADFDFSAQLKRKGGIYFDGTSYWASANAIFVRQGASFHSVNNWYPGYTFAYYDWGTLGYTLFSESGEKKQMDLRRTLGLPTETLMLCLNDLHVFGITASGIC